MKQNDHCRSRRRPGRASHVVAALVAVVVLTGCLHAEEMPRYRSFAELNGKRIGILTGTIMEDLVNQSLDLTQTHRFDDMDDMVNALLRGEIDCLVDDEPILLYVAMRDPRLRVLDERLQIDDYTFILHREDTELVADFNYALATMRVDGSLERIISAWLEDADGRLAQGTAFPVGERTVRLGVFPDTAPFVYCDANGTPGGIEVELMGEICRRRGLGLQVCLVDEFDDMFDAIQDRQVDVIAGCLAINPERELLYACTDPHYRGGVSVLVLDP